MANQIELLRRTHPELEKLATSILDRLGKYDNRALLIELLIEQDGIHIIPIRGLAEVAEAFIPIREGFIFVDEDQYLGAQSLRFRFSLAEEYAHTILHRPLFKNMTVEEVRDFQKALTDDQYLQIERDAKYLAGAILMKEPVFRERFAHHMRSQSERPHSQLKKLRYVIRQLSWDFNVSVQSVALRSVFLGLLDWEQYSDLMESWSISQ